MLEINLIDWRANNLLVLNRRFVFVLSVAMIITLVISLIAFSVIQSQINAAKEGVKYLDAQLQEVGGILTQINKIKDEKDSLLSRRKTIQMLQAERPLDVEIFDSLARMVPQGVVLRQIVRKENKITISGDSDSNYNVSVLIENAQRLPWVKLAKLGQLKSNDLSDEQQAQHVANKISFQIDLVIANNRSNSGVEDAAT